MVKFANRGKSKKSKRMTLQQKYKVERKIKEHHKKARRTARKLQAQGLKKKEKMEVIPNLYPFKAQLINAQEQERLAQIANKGKKKVTQMEQEEVEQIPIITYDHTGKKFNDYTDLIELSDVVIEVLDARDPNASRNQDIERQIISAGKTLILLITKADLVPKQETNKWKQSLKSKFPTILFSSINNSFDQTKQLISLIEEKQKSKDKIKIGFIGYPLMGKTTLIKFLSNNSHYTKPYANNQKPTQIQISPKVFMLDTMGVINANNPKSLLFNSDMDHHELIALIIKQVDKAHLRDLYTIPVFKKSQDFLEKIAKASGKLLKGGLPNLHAAAKQVINDLRSNKILFYTHAQ